ncbi:MAG: hypothetical protein F6K62_25995 [Sphaerospermopsis sp. SIO1G2]|nr:hypothetical protein [Sphaerospermopsis sp. SIO1G2]
MTAGLKLINTQEIQLSPIKIKHNQIVIFNNNDGYKIDMGSDVAFQEIIISSQQLLCRGRVNVNP